MTPDGRDGTVGPVGPGVPARSGRGALSRAQTLHLPRRTSVGLVVATTAATRTRTPGFHTVFGGELVILAIVTADLDRVLAEGRLLTYEVESVDDVSGAGWHAVFTGPVRIGSGPPPRDGRPAPFGSQASPGCRLLRMRPQRADGYRIGSRDDGL